MNRIKYSAYTILLILTCIYINACNYTTHRTFSRNSTDTTFETDADPDYNVSLDPTYQDFVNYMYMGNRSDNFNTYFNTYFMASQDYEEAMAVYRTSTIATYNKRLDSINITPILTQDITDKFNKVIERASKVIQLHKNSKFLDDAVLLIGKTYFYLADYLKAERQLNEFLSNLQPSPLYDEAILYLGMTKIRLGKTDEGEKILKSILASANDVEIRSEAAQQLGINEYTKKNFTEAINYFTQSINISKDNETKAIKQFILAKMYSMIDPSKAAEEFLTVSNFTSDYDQSFYARLNRAKGLNYLERYNQSLEELNNLRKKYRETPEYRQLVDLEIANTYFYEKKYHDAIYAYYDVIIDYPASIASADAYYYLGKYYETEKKNYLSAAIYYKKASTENGQGDFNDEALKKAVSFERYYALSGTIHDHEKIEIPAEDLILEKYRQQKNEEKGIDTKTNKTDPKNNPTRDNGNGKGSGVSSKDFSIHRDSLINRQAPGSDNLFKIDSVGNSNFINKDTTNQNFRPVEIDQLKKSQDSINANVIKKDSSGIDPLKFKNDSLKSAVDKKYSAYYELAELFLYDLNRVDSAEYYLNVIIDKYNEPEKNSKAMYALATIYQNNGEPQNANDMFRKIIELYPNTVFANESRKSIGIQPLEVEEETVKELYKNAEKSLLDGRNYEALLLLSDLNSKYPESAISPKILYTKGWIYENNLQNRDSAVAMYKLLKQKYPNSEFTASISPKLDQITGIKTTIDSTSKNDTTKNDPTKNDSTVVMTDSLGNVINKTEIKNEDQIKKDQNEKPDERIKEDLKSKDPNEIKNDPPPMKNDSDKPVDPVESPK